MIYYVLGAKINTLLVWLELSSPGSRHLYLEVHKTATGAGLGTWMEDAVFCIKSLTACGYCPIVI
jgi:hypothetical protein